MQTILITGGAGFIGYFLIKSLLKQNNQIVVLDSLYRGRVDKEFNEILKNKNVLPFGKSNLLEHKIKQLQKVDAIDNIYVSTDSDIYRDIALLNSAIVLERPKEFSGKGAVFNKFVKGMLSPSISILRDSMSSGMRPF